MQTKNRHTGATVPEIFLQSSFSDELNLSVREDTRVNGGCLFGCNARAGGGFLWPPTNSYARSQNNRLYTAQYIVI